MAKLFSTLCDHVKRLSLFIHSYIDVNYSIILFLFSIRIIFINCPIFRKEHTLTDFKKHKDVYTDPLTKVPHCPPHEMLVYFLVVINLSTSFLLTFPWKRNCLLLMATIRHLVVAVYCVLLRRSVQEIRLRSCISVASSVQVWRQWRSNT